MKKIIIFACISFFAGFFLPVQGADKRIAVYDFSAQGVTVQTAKTVSEWVQTAMTGGPYTVIERSKLSAVLGEQELQMAGLVDADQAVKAGKSLAANKILTGTLAKIGGKYVLSGRIIDVENGAAEFGHSEYTWQESDLDVCTQRFVDNVILKMSGKPAEKKAALMSVQPSVKNNDEREKDRVLKTVRTLYDGYSNKDFESYFSVIDDNARFWCSSYDLRGRDQIRDYRTKNTFANLDNFSYSMKDISVTVNGDTAEMTDTYVLSFTVKKNGRRITESAKERFLLKKKGNSWYIVENQEF